MIQQSLFSNPMQHGSAVVSTLTINAEQKTSTVAH